MNTLPTLRNFTVLALGLLATLAPSNSFAVERVWLGNNSTDIRDAANWVGGVVPAGNVDSMTFNAAGTAGANLVNPLSGNNTQFVGNFTLGQGAVQFNNSGTSYTLNGSSIRLGDGGVWNQSSGTVQTFNTILRLNTTNSFSFNASNAQTVVNASVDLNQGAGTRIITANFRESRGSVLFLNGDITNSNATPGTGSLTLTANASSGATGTVVLGGNNASLNGTITMGNTGTVLGVTLTNAGAIRNLSSIATTNSVSVSKLRYNAGAAMTYNGTAPTLNMGGIASAPTLDISLDGANQTFSSAALNQKGTVVVSTTSGANQTLTITGGTTFGVALGNQSAFLFPLGGASLSLNGVSTLAGSAATQVHTLVLSGTSQNNEINGAITGSTNSTAALAKTGASTWTLRGSNTFSGAGATTTLAGGTLGLDYSTNNDSKLADNAVLFLQGGSLSLNGGSHTEAVLSTTLTLGGTQIVRPSGSSTIALGALTQTSGALNIGGDNIATTTTTNGNSRLGGLSRVTVGSGTSYSFAKNDGANNIVGMTDGEYTTLTNTATNNATVYNLDGDLTSSQTTPIGSLRIQGGSSLTFTGANAPTFGNTTTTGTGGILFTGANDFTISSNVTSNGVRVSTGNLLVHAWGSGNLTFGGAGGTTSGTTNVVLGSAIEKFGTGRVIIAGNNTGTGTTTVGGGILQIDRNGALGNQTTGAAVSLQGGTLVADTTGGSFALNNGGSNSRNVTVGLMGGGIDVIGGNALTVSGVISSSVIGSGASVSSPLTLGSATTNGSIILSGVNTYTGGTILRGGTVEIQNASALGAYALGNSTGGQMNNYIQFTGGTLRYGTGVTSDLAQRIRYSTAAVNIDTNGQNVTFTNQVDYTNAAGLTKVGTGTLILAGTNTYTGATLVNAGTLLVNGSTAAGSAVTVASGATLGGSGTVGGSVTLNGVLAPGNSIGTLNIGGDLTWNSSGSLLTELGTAGVSIVSFGTSDQVAITGNFNKGTGSSFAFDFGGTGELGWYRLANWGGTTTFTDTDFTATNLGGGLGGTFQIDSGALYLNVIPEPSTYALVALGLGGLLALRRRKRA